MRDREFTVAHKALIEATQDKTTIPESFRLIGNNVLHGKKGKQHTVVIGVPVPSVKLDYGRIELRGDGKLLEKPREFEVHSWTLNHFNNVASTLGAINAADSSWGVGNINGKNTAGTLKYAARNYSIESTSDCNAGIMWTAYGTSNNGIQLGTGVTAVDWDGDFSIETQIAHGAAGGQLCYATSPTPSVFVWDGGSRTLTFYLDRYFDNFEAGAGSITATEMALVAYLWVGDFYYNLLAAALA